MATTISPVYLYTAFLEGHPRCKRPFKVRVMMQDLRLMGIFFWVKSLAPVEDKEMEDFWEEMSEDKSIKGFFNKLVGEVLIHDLKPDLNSNDFDWSMFFITSPPRFN